MPSKPVTLRDVARLAQVSYQTVSRVVNNSPYVSSKTRSRVIQAIRELNYHSYKTTRTLKTGQSQTVQVIAIENSSFGSIPSLLNTARGLGYQAALSVLRDPFSFDELQSLLDDCIKRMVDGFILITPELRISQEDLHLLCRGTPYVQIGADPGALTPSIIFDQRYGTRLAVQHLLNLGHRRIAEISGPLHLGDAKTRHQAYLSIMKTKKLETEPFQEGDFTLQSGYEATCCLLDDGPKFTAIFCANDWTAMGAMRALAVRGFRVPEDISVIGFDDQDFAQYLNPPLTTVCLDYYSMGKQSVEFLVSLIKDPLAPIHQRVLYPQLIVRQSTGPIRP
jgi:DNA-binding LacI/PurR family transcriptional regulator